LEIYEIDIALVKGIVMKKVSLLVFTSLIAMAPHVYSAEEQPAPSEEIDTVAYTENSEVAWRNQCEVKKKKPTCPPKRNPCCPEKKRQGAYITAFGGASFADSFEIATANAELKTGYVVGGAIGYLFPFGLRLEGEISYRYNGIDHDQTIHHFDIEFKQHSQGHFESLAYLGNILYNIPTNFWIVPYIGAGAGMSYNQYSIKTTYAGSDFHSRGRKDGFVWQAIGGISFVMGHFDINLEYRYYQTNVHYHDNNAIGGITYHF
jgi:opacity protein-like surface antigen